MMLLRDVHAMQLCIRKVLTKAVMMVIKKLPSFSVVTFLNIFMVL